MIWNRSIRQKLFLLVGILVAGISCSIYLYFPSRLESQATGHFEDKAKTICNLTAFYITSALYFEDLQSMAEVVSGAGKNRELIYVTIYDGSEREFATYSGDSFAAGGLPSESRERFGRKTDFIVEAPIVHKGQSIGRIETGFSKALLHAQIAQSRTMVAVVSLVILSVGCFAVFLISTLVSRPLREMVATAQQIEQGDLNRRATVFAPDEIGRLAEAFNAMVTAVQERTAALQVEISQRREVQAALQQSEQRFRAVMEQAADAIFIMREDLTFSEVNDEACKSLGYTRDELLGLSVFDIIAEPPLDIVGNLPERLRKGPMTVEALYRCSAGSSLPVEVRLGLMKLGDRQYILALARDVSARKAAEEARARAEDELEAQKSLSMRGDRLRSLGEMAAGIAHELNQPLTVVRGAAESSLIGIEEGWDMGLEAVARDMTTIVAQADRMTHIIEHVRMFARDAGKAERGSVQINEVVRSAVGMLESQFRSNGIRLVCELTENLPAVEANSFSLEEVILNLMSNARDAMMDGNGQLAEDSILRLRTGATDGQAPLVTVEVEDNGTGIDVDILEKVFDPFFTTKDPDKGTGLGLAVSKSILEEFGGQIDIQSQPDRGTTVSISLPPTTEVAIS